MKTFLIVALVCVNVALLAGLVVDTAAAQVTTSARGHYLMFTGKAGEGAGAVYVVDTATNELAAWRFDLQSKRLVVLRKRSLADDFRPSATPY